MTLATGIRLGPYEIVAPLGAGGMGEVWRAKDTRLGREVAIKVLPADVANDADRLRRFEQEARAASALSHSNILTLFDVGRDGDTSYLVTELLEGESLRARLAAGPLPLRKAIEIGVEIARGLAAAHARGIVHRDLKPENLFLTRDGVVKILDFGLAKLTLPESGKIAEATTVPGMTATGMVLGTAGYMAPEQVRGDAADARADLFALGCVLYELASGRRAFAGNSAPETLSAILRDDPAPLAAPGPTGTVLEGIVRRCLEKRPDDRFQSARDLSFALEALRASGSGVTAPPTPAAPRSRRSRRPLQLAALAAAALLVGIAVGRGLARSAPPPLTRLRQLTYSGHDAMPAVSPDARTIVFASDRDGRSRIWIRQMGTGGEAPITGGIDRGPRYFPDGQSILYVHDEGGRTDLYRIALVGGQPRKLIEGASSADVSPDGRRIAFLATADEGEQPSTIFGLAGADGSDVRELLRVEGRQNFFLPRFSPDGRTFAVGLGGQAGARAEIRLVPVDGKPPRSVPALLPNAVISSVLWAPDGGSLYYMQGISGLGGVVASEGQLIRYDLATGRSTPLLWLPVTGQVLNSSGPGRLVFDAAPARQNLLEVALAPGVAGGAGRRLTQGFTVDRQPVVSPDGERVIFSSTRNGNLDLWSLELATGATLSLTDDAADDWDPGLTADGRRLLWSSNRSGSYEIWTADADGSHPRQVTHDGDAENPTATPDGAWIVYASGASANLGLWKIRADGSQPTRLASGLLLNPEVSPDGRYVAYRIAPPANLRAYVRVLRVADGAAVPFEIAVRGGSNGHAGRVRWMPDGRALAFVGVDDQGRQRIFAQDFVPGTDTSATRRLLGGIETGAVAESFGISRDGSRLIVASLEQSSNLMMIENVPGLASSPAESK